MISSIDTNNVPELLETIEAAKILRRAPQSLRAWACKETGPLKPVRLFGKGGRLLWRRADVEKILNGENA